MTLLDLTELARQSRERAERALAEEAYWRGIIADWHVTQGEQSCMAVASEHGLI